MPTPWQRELATIFTPMRAELDAYWEEVYRDAIFHPSCIGRFADRLCKSNGTKVDMVFDEDFFVGDFDSDIACYSWILLGTGALIDCRLGHISSTFIFGAFPALAIAHALSCVDADGDLYAGIKRIIEHVADQKLEAASASDDALSADIQHVVATMRVLAAALQGRGKGDHIKLAALFKSLRKAHRQPERYTGTSKQLNEMEKALSRLGSSPYSKRAAETLFDAAHLIG